MTKNEILSKCWIPYSTRLPPNEDVFVAAWNYVYKRPVIGLSRVFRAQQSQIQNNPNFIKKLKMEKVRFDIIECSGYYTSHWMFLPDPKNDNRGYQHFP